MKEYKIIPIGKDISKFYSSPKKAIVFEERINEMAKQGWGLKFIAYNYLIFEREKV